MDGAEEKGKEEEEIEIRGRRNAIEGKGCGWTVKKEEGRKEEGMRKLAGTDERRAFLLRCVNLLGLPRFSEKGGSEKIV